MKKTLLIVFAVLALSLAITIPASAQSSKTSANGFYEGEEIYYIDQGLEVGVTERGENDIYVIGGDRLYQPQVVEFIPGDKGYSPHWNVNLVNTAEGVTVGDIVASPYVSELYLTEGVLFDDIEDILGAEADGLVTIVKPGVVVNCPIISEKGADAPGLVQASEEFEPFNENEGF